MFPEKEDDLAAILQSQQFQQLLKTDATTTSEGQQYVAEYFEVEEQWETKKTNKHSTILFELLCLVKQTSTKDYIWISLWEGMHRHATITMSLLCADITYDTNNCYVPKTLTKTSFSKGQIKRYADPDLQPGKKFKRFFTVPEQMHLY
jgi:hypothetical protein